MAEQSQVSFQRSGDAILVRLSGSWRLRGGMSSEATVSSVVSYEEVMNFERRDIERVLAASRERVQHLVSHASLGTLMSSVVSLRSIGLNQPLTGQASSSFTKPSLRRRSFPFSRYSPRSIRST